MPITERSTQGVWCIDSSDVLYFHSEATVVGRGSTGLLAVSVSGQLLANLTADVGPRVNIDAVAVIDNGDIFFTVGRRDTAVSSLLRFDSSLRLKANISLEIDGLGGTFGTRARLMFDRKDTLWMMEPQGEALYALDFNGNLVDTIASAAPKFSSLTSMKFDRSFSYPTLLVAQSSLTPWGMRRIDASNGHLLQSFVLPSRLTSSCSMLPMQTSADGFMWIYAVCRVGLREDPIRRLHVVDGAGRIQREFLWAARSASAQSFVVDPFSDRLFVSFYVSRLNASVSFIEAYTVRGAPLFNLSLDAVQPPTSTGALRVLALSDGAVHILSSDGAQITSFDIDDGAQRSQVKLPVNTTLGGFGAIHPDVNSGWFIAQLGSPAVLRLDSKGAVLQEFVLPAPSRNALLLTVSADGGQLFAYHPILQDIVVWRIPPRSSELHRVMAT